jgi:signal transduction histidine kinase
MVRALGARRALTCGVVATIATAPGALTPLTLAHPTLGALALAGSAGWLATGYVLERTGAAPTSGRWFTAAAVIWPGSWAVLERSSAGDPGPFLGLVLSGTFWICIAWAVFIYPPELARTRSERCMLAMLSLWLLAAPLALNLISTPGQSGFDDRVWWPNVDRLVPDTTTFAQVSTVFGIGTLALALWAAVLLARRLSGLSRFEQRVLRPAAVAMILAALAGGVTSAVQGYAPQGDVWTATVAAQGVALLCVPASLLVSYLGGRLAVADAAGVVGRLPRPATPETVRDALRAALHDDTLELRTGPEALEPRPQEHGIARQYAVEVLDSSGRRVAVILADERLASRPDLLDVARDAASFALENAQLQTQLERSVQDVKSSRARIVTVGQQERRRLERNLHDGAQQRLIAVALSLEVARSATQERRTRDLLAAVKEDLDETLSELRELAQGLNPSLLSSVGLAEAVRRRSGLHSFPVHIDLAQPDPPQDVGEAAYYVICEALTNSQKHSQCTRADVCGRVASGSLSISVRDDGVGGADAAGGGLRGLSDRVEALGGLLHITSPAGAGTTVTMEVPCA